MGHPATGHGPSATDSSPGHVDHNPERTERSSRPDGGGHRLVVVHIAAHRPSTVTELFRQFGRPVGIEVEHGHPHPDVHQPSDRGRSETAGATGHDGRTPCTSIRWFPSPASTPAGLCARTSDDDNLPLYCLQLDFQVWFPMRITSNEMQLSKVGDKEMRACG